MQVLSTPLLQAIYYNFNLLYQGAYERVAPWYKSVATVAPSTTRENRYAWLRLIPRLREWVGERVLENLVATAYSIVNHTYEKTIAVDKEDIEDEQLGVYSLGVSMLGDQAARWPDDLMTTAIQSGQTTACFDGQNFFSSSHPVGDPAGDTYSNNFVTTPLNWANYNTVRSTMLGYLGEDGKPLLINPTHLLVPPALEAVGRQILHADLIATVFGSNTAAAAPTNVLKGTAELLVIRDLAGQPADWFLADLSKPVRPLIFQAREMPALVSLTDPTSSNVFMQRKFIYGVASRGFWGYSLPFLMARGTANGS